MTYRNCLMLIAALALSGCGASTHVVENTGKTVVLTGGPGGMSTVARDAEYLRAEAERLCRQNGYSGAEGAGTGPSYVVLHQFRCI